MFKFNLKFIFISIFIILISCGYTPIYSKKNNILYIKEIKYFGDEEISNELKTVLERYKIKKKGDKSINLNITSSQNKKITQKNTKGEASSYEIALVVMFEAKSNNIIISKKTIKEKNIYSSKNTISQEKNFEKRLIKNMSRKISNQIILDITQKLE